MKLFILLHLFSYSLAQIPDIIPSEDIQKHNKEECGIDHKPENNIIEYKLVLDLAECGYDAHKPPVPNGTESLEINTHFIMKSFKFDSELQEFSAFMWTALSWVDERLTWDPAKYKDVTSTTIPSMNIWAPNVRLFNNIGDDFDEKYFYIPCNVKNTGRVECIAWILYEAKCSTDLRDWPYDAQYCNLEFGFYSGVATRMQMTASRKAISMLGAEYGTEWDIMDYEQKINKTSEKQLIMKFKLERHAEVLTAIVIFPAFILSILTFSSLFIDARLKFRLLVICFSLLCHNYFITDLSAEIPENTKDPPRLLMFYRGSLILTSILLVVCFILNAVSKREATAPNWITTVNNFVFPKFIKFVIRPRWETKDDTEANNFLKDWIDVANIANTVCIFMSIIVYVGLYCVFMPHPIPFN